MIDNPLPDIVMEQKDNEYLSEQFYEHCEDKAKEIAKEFNLLPEFLDDFIEYYADICSESDEGYSLINDKSLIDNWWEENSYMYDDYDEPYIIYKPQIQKSLPEPIEDYEPSFVPITRYSRCKRYSGAVIKCPECNSSGQIYHLSWSALQCQNCKKMVDKFDWFIEKGKYSKT